MKRIILVKIYIVIIFSIVSIVLGQQKASQNKKVKIVQNSEKGIWDINQKKRIELKKDIEIGMLEGDENKMFYRISDVKVDSRGNIYVLERGNKRVQKFDKNGNYLMTIGKEGEGPGEFTNPIELFVTNDLFIYVLDDRNMRVSKFSHSGNFLNSFRPKHRPIDFIVDSNKNTIVLENGHPDFKFFKYDEKGNIIQSFGEIIKGNNIFETAIFNKGCVSIDEYDCIYMSYTQPYKIEKYDSNGKLTAIYSRELPYKIVEPETNIEDQSKNIRAVRFNFYTRLAADIVVKNEKIFHLITDGKSILTEGRYIDIFDFNGVYLQKIDLKNPIRKFCLDSFGNFYFAVEISQVIKSNNNDNSIFVPKVERYVIK